MNTEQEWNEKKVWTCFLDQKILIRIEHWGLDLRVYEGAGQWCYYLRIYESLVEDFEEWWLSDQISEWGRVHHDYHALDLDNLELHGGCTYYAKDGHSVGHRSVEIGCDYGHYGEIGVPKRLERVQAEALNSAKKLIQRLKFKEKSEHPVLT